LWTQFFSIFAVIVSTVIVLKKLQPASKEIRYTSLIALSAWLIGDITVSSNLPYQEVLHIILQTISLSLILVVLLQFIRQRKPVIFRYPYYMVYVPLLIPFAQLIVMEAQIIREIIFMSLQGVVIIVFALLSFGYSEELKYKLLTIVGLLFLVWGFAFFWILQEYYIVYELAWGLTNAGGMIACIYSFSDLLESIETSQTAVT
jgi:hypothetical protein